jgi:hypothetical protein
VRKFFNQFFCDTFEFGRTYFILKNDKKPNKHILTAKHNDIIHNTSKKREYFYTREVTVLTQSKISPQRKSNE